jgi:hypothetical protein
VPSWSSAAIPSSSSASSPLRPAVWWKVTVVLLCTFVHSSS